MACLLCGAVEEPSLQHRCAHCGGALEPRYRSERLAPRTAGLTPERTYFEHLPLGSADVLDDGVSVSTPCRPAPVLGAAIGVPHLWIKDESVQPTGSTKDRLASVVLAVLRQSGVTEFVASSTGNSSTALARAVQRDPAMRAHFFCGREFLAYQGFTPDARIRLSVVDGTYAQAKAAAREFGRTEGVHLEGGFFNWARREGLKLAYLEAIDQMESTPDVVVQAVSSGMGMVAADKAVREYSESGRVDRVPRYLMVQQSSCAPMAHAWARGARELSDSDRVENPEGLATAILLGDGRPYYPYLAGIVARAGGAIVAVGRQDLIDCRAMLVDLEGVDVCYASAATIAGIRAEAAAGRITPDDTVLAVLTGKLRPN
ncbi:pyridoxal-phosphate dependent enzyme [Lentzea sp. BCCO 10_0061]|uniref:Pyridoxal-phosphate dependent enzyme n=1 Tax=Lentzea sokolovensis TaxID=3095429 RepID=A0ABU4V5Q3_9PSEU|nr:pyridoxal-phosphate dependent enzyme [Lentzea sp. BCCO 10_0061]MDX8147111.1 pyridoxal-phosphate dependent enzyme [Lentzea sp. BCCO 10_0061]